MDKTFKLKAIVLDPLFLGTMYWKYKDITAVCVTLKKLAKKLNVPVISSCYVRRIEDKRNPPIPNLNDLEGVGAIEKYADKILFVYREAYYSGAVTPYAGGPAQIIVAKNSSGRTGTVDLKYIPTYTRFDNN